ncbi:UPF0182 family protein [Nocardioides cynanchi]|uniref:UPF0182 family membrane protein n=1 Tax=Nocardioides cynanchi TaxID=2558918 RepID=UPI00124454C7|nr:UPF0182 family protein [Nocardioides cynanchi]
MSEHAEEEFEDFRPRRSRRGRILLFSILGLVVTFFLITLFASLYTDRLWYSSVGYSSVFDKMLWTRVGLFVGFGLLMSLAVAGNMVIAYRARPFYRPDSPEQTGLDRYREAVTPLRTLLLVSLSGVIGLFGGVAANGQWRSFLLWANRVPFHTSDPYFHKDVGFYVFTLPWLHFVVGYAIAVLVLSALAAAVVHYLYGGIRLQVAQDRLSGTATVQLSVLVGLLLVVKAFGYWLDRFDLVTSGGLLTGMGYTDQHAVLPARNILIGVALICAVLFFLTTWRRTWLLAGVGISLLLVTSILLGLIWPAFVQHFQVSPTEGPKEAPYIQTNIDASRAAYDLNGIEVKQYANSTATAATVQQIMDETASVPVVDPQLVQKAFELTQQAQSYYKVSEPLDVDHYQIDGHDRSIVLGVRDLDQKGIDPKDQNWGNLHTVYTHGNGVIAAFGNQRPPSDTRQTAKVQWAQGQNPGQDSLEQATGPFEQRIYFGEGSPSYSIVGRTTASNTELDLSPSGTPTHTTYDGSGGVDVGGFFNKLMYAIKFGDSNFLLSGRVGPDSKVLYYRNPAQRVEKVAPWLTLDTDIYPAVVDGKVLWIVDGYTTTDQYPQSQRTSFSDMITDSLSRQPGVQTLPTDQINYMRNAVKATVDAYTGQVTLYAWDETDPMLQAWSSAFPGTIQARSAIPPDLLQHLRYPEDFFKVQRYQFARYHVTDPSSFYTANNRWAVPEDPNVQGKSQTPVRMYTRNPVTGLPMWSLTSNYVPRDNTNLVGFVAVDSDATSSDYGQIRVEEPPDQNVPGPGQVQSTLLTSPQITRKTQSFRLGDASPEYGNLLTVPLSSGLMYVEPVYAARTQGDSASLLTLRYVLVSYNGKVGIGDTLVNAITDMTGGGGSKPPPSNPPPTKHHQGKGATAKAHALLLRAQQDFAAADRAFNHGHFGQYVKLNHQARAEVARALNLLG